jgi:hypothetical protein
MKNEVGMPGQSVRQSVSDGKSASDGNASKKAQPRENKGSGLQTVGQQQQQYVGDEITLD